MTTVRIDLRTADEITPAEGAVLFSPSRRLHINEDPDYIVLPTPVTAILIDGRAEVDLRPTEATWVWYAQERVPNGIRRYVQVPATGPVDYGDLVDVDPGSLALAANPEPAWWLALEDVIVSGGDQALLDHINSPTPHAAYDTDIPSLTLLFENGLI